MRVTAVIVNYWTASLVADAVASLDPTRDDLEIVVVDNTADPGEQERLATLLPPSVKRVNNEANRGFAAACNQAHGESSGGYLLLLNPDAYLRPGAMDTLAAFLDEHPRVAAVAPRIFWDEESRFLHPPATLPGPYVWAGERVFREFPSVAGFLASRWRRQAAAYWTATVPVREPALSGGAVMLRRSALETSGGLFDQRFFMYYEDSDLFLRLRRGGWVSFMVPQAEAVHYFNQSGGQGAEPSALKMRYMAESLERYRQKHYRRSVLARWAQRFRSEGADAAGLPGVPVEDDLPEFSFTENERGGWVVLFGLNPLLAPSAASFGEGKRFVFPREIRRRLSPGTYYLAAFRADGTRVPYTPLLRWVLRRG